MIIMSRNIAASRSEIALKCQNRMHNNVKVVSKYKDHLQIGSESGIVILKVKFDDSLGIHIARRSTTGDDGQRSPRAFHWNVRVPTALTC